MSVSDGTGDRTRLRVAFQTLGCRLNQYETDAVATDFTRGGYEIVSFTEEADCYIINTCTVTDKSDRKSRNQINRARKRANEPVVVVTGCFVESSREYVESLPGVTYAVGNEAKYRIFDLVDAHVRDELGQPVDGPVSKGDLATQAEHRGAARPSGATRFGFGDALDGFHTRATIKIQDGCDNFCSFCIIPYVRGRAESRRAADILEHARRVIDSGAREIVLTGVNMGRYDDDGRTLVSLVEELLELPGDFRIRLSSVEPDFRGDGLEHLVGHPRFAPHLHLCLQSGSDRVLLAMRRQYTVSGFLEMVDAIRTRDPSFNFTTDVLVGFPGESDDEFGETLDTVRRIGFSHIHTFPYSIRQGTRAARMDGQVDDQVKAARSAAIRELSETMKRAYRSRLVGSRERLLIERESPVLSGYGARYVPIEVSREALGSHATEWHNRFIEVEITGISDGEDPVLYARPVDAGELSMSRSGIVNSGTSSSAHAMSAPSTTNPR